MNDYCRLCIRVYAIKNESLVSLRKSNAFQPTICSKNQTGKGIFLGCSPNCLEICMGCWWRNRIDLLREFAKLVTENKKCTGSTKASVGNQSSFECRNNRQSWGKQADSTGQIQKSTVHNGEFPQWQPSEKTTN